jgi:hypothetical protein
MVAELRLETSKPLSYPARFNYVEDSFERHSLVLFFHKNSYKSDGVGCAWERVRNEYSRFESLEGLDLLEVLGVWEDNVKM